MPNSEHCDSIIKFKTPLAEWTDNQLEIGWGAEPDKDRPSPIGEAIKAEIDRRKEARR